jgi:hypothetical protein
MIRRLAVNMATERGKAGPLFEDFLREQGTCEETTGRAVKRVLAYQLAAAIKEGKSGRDRIEH